MKKLFLLIFTIISLEFVTNAQYTSTIRGKIIDKQSQMGLPGVTVVLLASNPINGVATDIDGEFRLKNVPVGRCAIQISYLGYETVILSNLTVVSGKELEINVGMLESMDEIEAVEVVATIDKKTTNNEMSTVSARTLSIDEATRFSGSFQDPARMSQNYAGVSGASDDRNDIIIRGNSPLGVLWQMEGINIPSPNHFSTLGTTGGPISMLNINNLSNSDFMTSAWSADYGNALSGVFDLKLRNGNHDKREYVAQVGFNGFEIGAEGPFKKGKKASYLVNYRYSTLGVLTSLGINLGTGSAVPQYQDLTFKIDMPTKKMGRFSFWGIGGLSDVEFDATEEVDSTNLFANNDEHSKFNSKTFVLGASHLKFINDNTFSKLTIALSSTRTNGNVHKVDFLNNEMKKLQFTFDQNQTKVSANYKVNKKVNKKNTVTIGLLADQYFTYILDSSFVAQIDDYVVFSNNRGSALLMQSYINWQHRFSKKTTLNAGIHYQYFVLTNSHAFEPRLGLKYDLNKRNKVSIGFGLHSQLQPISLYFREEKDENSEVYYPNQNLGFTKALHSVLAYDYSFSENMRLKAEVYYQYIYNVPVDSFSSTFSMLNQGVDFTLPKGTNYLNSGSGSNYGLELTLEKFLSKGYYFLTTASLFQSKYVGSDRVQRNSVFNGNYVFNALAGKEFKVIKNILISSVDFKVTYAGGRRYTPIDLEESASQGREVRVLSKSFEEQYDPYFKIDFKVGTQLNLKKVSMKFIIDITNVTNQENIFLAQYSVSQNKVLQINQRGIFPLFIYQIYF